MGRRRMAIDVNGEVTFAQMPVHSPAHGSAHSPQVYRGHNVFTTIGKSALAAHLDSRVILPAYIAVGTGSSTPAASDTALSSEIARVPIIATVQAGKYSVLFMAKFDQYQAHLDQANPTSLLEAGLFDDGGNLLYNPGFDRWLKGPGNSVLIDGWVPAYGASVLRSSAFFGSGSYSAQIVSSFAEGLIFQAVGSPNHTTGLSPYINETMVFRAWVRQTGVSGGRIEIRESAGSNEYATFSSSCSGSGKWELLTVSKTIRPDTNQISVRVRIPWKGISLVDSADLFIRGNLWARASINLKKSPAYMLAAMWKLTFGG
jgi:hypothetical protein